MPWTVTGRLGPFILRCRLVPPPFTATATVAINHAHASGSSPFSLESSPIWVPHLGHLSCATPMFSSIPLTCNHLLICRQGFSYRTRRNLGLFNPQMLLEFDFNSKTTFIPIQ
ncbi:uncharacterized protein EI90DRAFT_3075182 [Cantharellus anzutake]|uniref:uncharacterized protein n=1 Tax=Cantharellus anzutake TaxID=1750568 RepID=UPI0019069C33|nr:uncharacterized protein EI90DRAFT_3075182 [Cantharellus anzutake]KAF8324595.1 hypothetical protein EI90DRAFT_3075182 [Cantharellus anzutake]